MAVCLLSAVTISAREYQHSVGIIVGNSFGLSYKGYVRSSDHFVVETNLLTKMIVPGQFTMFGKGLKGKSKDMNMLSLEANPNFYYQGLAAEFNGVSMYWYAGGGIGLGALWSTWDGYKNLYGFDDEKVPALKFDEHAVAGLEVCFSNIPLNLSMDFRPGIGEFVCIKNDISGIYFDWTVGISLRYRIGE